MDQFRCPLAQDPHSSKARTGDAQDWSKNNATERCLGGCNVEDETFLEIPTSGGPWPTSARLIRADRSP